MDDPEPASRDGIVEPKRTWLSRARGVAIPALLAVVSFFVITGGRILKPSNIAWMQGDDPVTYFIGWHFYRNTPWGLPLGENPRYGADLSSGIIFNDIVPLFAFAFKAINAWLPEIFQYFGFWALCCFVLQAWFAWLLVGIFARAPLLRVSGTALFVLAPTFLWRLQGHYQMVGQWLVLAALYICLGPRRLARGAAWPALLFAAGLIHTYMTAMVLGLWLTDWVRRVVFEGRTWADLIQLILVPSLVLLGFWQAGLFMVSEGITKAGFGVYRMNLASLIDPSGWSYLLKDFPEGDGDYEGFNYLGLGVIVVALFALPALKGALPALRARRHYWPLLVLLVGLTLFAISNRIALADREFVIPLPERWIERANVLRGSGRMFWPVYYGLFWLLIRSVVRRYSARVAGILLASAVLLQAVDTSAGWLPIRQTLMVEGSTWDSPLKSAFWSEVPTNYREIRLVPPARKARNYSVFAYFAAMHGLSTNAFYLARIDMQKLREAKAKATRELKTGNYEPGILYILESRYAKLARRTANPELDLFAKIDGFFVLAPGWKCRPKCRTALATSLGDCSTRCAEIGPKQPAP